MPRIPRRQSLGPSLQESEESSAFRRADGGFLRSLAGNPFDEPTSLAFQGRMIRARGIRNRPEGGILAEEPHSFAGHHSHLNIPFVPSTAPIMPIPERKASDFFRQRSLPHSSSFRLYKLDGFFPLPCIV